MGLEFQELSGRILGAAVEVHNALALEDIPFAQVRSSLKATGLRIGLLFNFNAPTLVIKRVVL